MEGSFNKRRGKKTAVNYRAVENAAEIGLLCAYLCIYLFIYFWRESEKQAPVLDWISPALNGFHAGWTVILAELCIPTGGPKAASLPSCGYTEKQKRDTPHSW